MTTAAFTVKAAAKPQQLGRALSILFRAEALEHALHEEANAFHAPSECHELIGRAEAARMRLATRRAKAIAGHRQPWRAARSQIGDKALRRAYERVVSSAARKLSPM